MAVGKVSHQVRVTKVSEWPGQACHVTLNGHMTLNLDFKAWTQIGVYDAHGLTLANRRPQIDRS